MKRYLTVLIVLCSCSLGLAHAGFYAGASWITTDAEFETAVDQFDTDDSSWKGYAGFTILKFLALEATYRDLGEHSDTVGGATVNAEIEAFDASARGIVPLGRRFNVFAKAGYALINVEGAFDGAGGPSPFDEDEWELFYGAGVELNFGGHFGLRAEWEEYDVETSLNSFSAGAFFKF